MLDRGNCIRITGRTARAGISLAAAAMFGGGIVAALPASPASATGTGTDLVTVSSSLNPSVYGEKVGFNVSVAATGLSIGIPTGLLTFSYTNSFNGAKVFNPVCSESGSNVVPLDLSGLATCTPTTALLGGNDAITASYGGDLAFLGNLGILSTPGGQTVSPMTTTIAVVDNGPNPSTYGQPVSMTTTVTAHPTANPQASVIPIFNTVNFSGNGSPLPDCSSINFSSQTATTATASCSTKDLPAGSPVTVGSFYNGDGNYQTALATGINHTVNKATTAASTPLSSSNPVPVNSPVTYTTTVTPATLGFNPSTGTVTFFDGAAHALCSGGNPAALAVNLQATCATTYASNGNHSITAVYGGDSNYAASPASGALNQMVGNGSTTTVANNGPSPSTYGQSVSFTATVAGTGASAPTGNVTFSTGATVLCTKPVSTSSGKTTATCATSALPVGSDPVTAAYSGDGVYQPSAGGTNQTVNKSPTTVSTPGSSSNPVALNTSVTYTTTLSPATAGASAPTGTVTFSDNGAAIPGCSGANAPQVASDLASCTIAGGYGAIGQHSITAVYNGDGNYGVSPASAALNQVVCCSTGVAVTSSGPSTYGQKVTFTATLTAAQGFAAPTGTVSFSHGATVLCNNSQVSTLLGVTTATCSASGLPVGSDPITASYPGDGIYQPAQGAVVQTVSKAPTTVSTPVSSSNPVPLNQPVTYTTTVIPASSGPSAPTGTVTFSDNGAAIPACSGANAPQVVNNQAACTLPAGYGSNGPHSITAVYNGDSNYAPSISQAMSQDVALPGYWVVAANGAISGFGPTQNLFGSESGAHLNAPIVGMARDPATGGYWLVGGDGGVFAFNAPFYGSMAGQHLNKPIVGIVAAPGGNGYWLVAADGGVFTFGPGAPFYGSEGASHLNQPVVGIAVTPGGGYRLVAADGGVFTFGPGATFYGSLVGTHLNKPVVGIAAAPGGGYWLASADGGVFTFGPGAHFYGSEGAAHLNKPIVGIAAASGGNGYWLVGSDGGVFSFGPTAAFYGSLAGQLLNGPVVGIAGVG